MDKFTITFRVKGGDCYEVPTVGFISYRWALRAVLNMFCLKLSDVTLCKE